MYKKKIISFFLAIFLTISAASLAQDVALRADHPDRYVVVKGDTLWDISARFLRDPWQWPAIWQANPQIDNPHLIYPGDVIRLVYVDGQPRLILERGRADMKLTPEGRIEPIHKAIPTIPLDAIAQFLIKPRIMEKEDLDKAPYILSSQGDHLIAYPDVKVYVRRLAQTQHDNFAVVRRGEVYTDPVTQEVLGYEAKHVGDAVLLSGGDPATMRIVDSKHEILNGDLLLPSGESTYDTHFTPKAPDQNIDGQIIKVIDGVSQVGQYQVVVINRGEREGLQAGDVLHVFQQGATVRDPYAENKNEVVELPDEKAGTILVFRTFDKVSYALVMLAKHNMHVFDPVRSPQ